MRSSWLLALVGLGMVGCGPKSGAAPPLARPGQLSCDATFKFETSRPDKSFFNFSTTIATESKAVGQLNAAVLAYALEADGLCKQYNAGLVDARGFRERSDRISDRLAKATAARPLIAKASQSPSLLERKQVLAGAYSAIVPDAERQELVVDFSVSAQLPADPGALSASPCKGAVPALLPALPLTTGQTIPSGTRVAFMVTVSAPAYVYLMQRNQQTKELTVLFPQPGKITTDNPLRPGQLLRIPDQGQSYCLNEHDVGLETVMVVASLAPLPSLDAALKTAPTMATPSGPDALETGQLGELARIGLQKEAPADCKARALELVNDVPPPCTRSRGVVVEGETGASFRARTEAADTLIAKSFPFEHVEPGRYRGLVSGSDPEHTLEGGAVVPRGIRMEE